MSDKTYEIDTVLRRQHFHFADDAASHGFQLPGAGTLSSFFDGSTSSDTSWDSVFSLAHLQAAHPTFPADGSFRHHPSVDRLFCSSKTTENILRSVNFRCPAFDHGVGKSDRLSDLWRTWFPCIYRLFCFGDSGNHHSQWVRATSGKISCHGCDFGDLFHFLDPFSMLFTSMSLATVGLLFLPRLTAHHTRPNRITVQCLQRCRTIDGCIGHCASLVEEGSSPSLRVDLSALPAISFELFYHHRCLGRGTDVGISRSSRLDLHSCSREYDCHLWICYLNLSDHALHHPHHHFDHERAKTNLSNDQRMDDASLHQSITAQRMASRQAFSWKLETPMIIELMNWFFMLMLYRCFALTVLDHQHVLTMSQPQCRQASVVLKYKHTHTR